MPLGLGVWELVIAAVVIALLFGPAKVPSVARSLGRGVREVRAPIDELKRSVSPAALLSGDEERAARPPEAERERTPAQPNG
jgi:TatA/E family protein of Tat protein translocase